MDQTLRRNKEGFTFVEILAASVVGSVVAGGMMMAYVTAARIQKDVNEYDAAEGAGYALESMERFRNQISPNSTWITASLGRWTAHPLPNPAVNSNSGGSESLLSDPTAQRKYRLDEADCDGDSILGDCYQMQVRVCWGGDC